jgi:hypothetical protein
MCKLKVKREVLGVFNVPGRYQNPVLPDSVGSGPDKNVGFEFWDSGVAGASSRLLVLWFTAQGSVLIGDSRVPRVSIHKHRADFRPAQHRLSQVFFPNGPPGQDQDLRR